MNFGIKLQTLRKERRMSQEALAEQLNVSRQAVSKWEMGGGYPEMDTIIMISNLFGVTLDYLMKDADDTPPMDEDSVVLSSIEVKEFLSFKKRFGAIIATAVASIIASTSIVVFFPDQNLAIGAMLLVVAVAVGSIIVIGMISEKYAYLNKKIIILRANDLEMMKDKQKKFHTFFPIMIATGVFIIIASVAAMVIFGEEFDVMAGYKEVDVMAGYFLWFVAIAVFIFIFTGVIESSYRQICDTKKFVTEAKKEEKENEYYAVTMPLAAMVYMVLGFGFDLWHPGWLVFPITAMLTFAFSQAKK